MAPNGNSGASAPGDEEEDDYMNMTFEDPTPAKETSIQRTQRLKKESLARGNIKPKAQIAAEEAEAREKALATSMLDRPGAAKSKGFAMMAKMGFTGGGLGKKKDDGEGPGRKEPIQVSVKEDRGGIGLDAERKRKAREAMEERGDEVKAVKVDPDEYRERIRKEREDARTEKQLYAAQRIAEQMDDEQEQGQEQATGSAAAKLVDLASETKSSSVSDAKSTPRSASSRPLKSIPILYRGLVRHREEKERDQRMRYDLEQSSLSRLPTYDDEDEDEDDKKALGKKRFTYVAAEDLDEEDEELDQFNALEVGERLGMVVQHLRDKSWYCFWCKMKYEDEKMEGCPGLTEEDHD